MATSSEAILAAPAEGRITDESFAQARKMIGVYLRPEGPYLQDATPDTLRNFCNGIGDLNPLYRDLEHGRQSRYGTMVGHPTFPLAFGWPGRTRWGFPGVHGFGAGNDWEFFRHVRPGDRITCLERVVGVEEKQGKFSGRLALQYVEASFLNQRDEIVARALGWCTRHERKASRDAGKYKDITAYEYPDDEMSTITDAALSEPETIRGESTRYFEDVEEGEELTKIVRGPLTLMDTMGFLVGCGRGHANGVLMREAVKHPGHFFRNPDAGGGVEYTGIGHHRESVAKSIGAPGTYDYGPQRLAWLCSLVTNWMGDEAFLKRIRAEYRRFNSMGDTTWFSGHVSSKYIKDGHTLVDLELSGVNQRGEQTTPGLATVRLPSREVGTDPLIDGSTLSLDLPTVR